MFSCDKLDDNNDLFSDWSDDLKAGQIEIKAYPGQDSVITFDANVQMITIDWGEGSIESFTSNGGLTFFEHKYSNKELRTIRVITENMSLFRCFYAPSFFQELRFGNCTELKEIYCGYNQLSVLDVSKCTALTHLSCYSNQLPVLDVSKNVALKFLYCSNNRLTELDVSNCSELKEIYCNNNHLFALDVSGCIELERIHCDSNHLSASALNSLFTNLPVILPLGVGLIGFGIIYCSENQGYSTSDKSIATEKRWQFY